MFNSIQVVFIKGKTISGLSHKPQLHTVSGSGIALCMSGGIFDVFNDQIMHEA